MTQQQMSLEQAIQARRHNVFGSIGIKLLGDPGFAGATTADWLKATAEMSEAFIKAQDEFALKSLKEAKEGESKIIAPGVQ